MAVLSKITLPDGTTYDFKDSISGYTSNTGTITKISTTAPLSGGASSGEVTLSIGAASSTAAGTLSSAYFTLLSKLNAHISFDSRGNIMFT